MDTIPIRNLLGAGASWAIRNDVGTTNGLPIGGTASAYHSGAGRLLGSPGFGIAEASLGSQIDAFDGASLLFVNNQIFVAPATVDITGFTATGGYSTMTAGAVTLSDLNVTTQFYADQTLPVVRTFVSFTNPTATAITVPVTLATNVGSDADTTIQATSSGDTTFAVNDRWVITDDDPTNGALSDTHVLGGSGNPNVIADSVSQTVFDYVPNSGTQGVLANYTITVPANSTRNLLFFNGVNQTSADAKSTAAIYNTVSSLQSSTLLNGLTSQQLANTLNWDLAPQISVGNTSPIPNGNQKPLPETLPETLPVAPKPIVGSAKADVLSGSVANDWLSGEAGNDNLVGGAGDDVLVGGAGGDTLTGGLGADRFEYSVSKGRIAVSSVRKAPKQVTPLDHITDLNPNQGDRIELQEAQLSRRPLSVSNVGQVQRGRMQIPSLETVRRTLPSLYFDKNSVKKGSQAVRPNEAIFFQIGSGSYLAVNDRQSGFSPSQDLVIDVTGMQFLPGDRKIGALNGRNYFA